MHQDPAIPDPGGLLPDEPPPAAGCDRRSLLQFSGSAGLGLLCAPQILRPDGRPARADAPAQAVIQIFLSGGLSHLDTFDPKPYAPVEVRGEFKTLRSKLDGAPFGELLRHTAGIADQLCVIRSMTHSEAAHERGRHNMLTGQRPSPAVTFPSMGSVVAHELGSRENLPPYVGVPSANGEFMGTGYLSAAYAPFSLGSEPNSRGFRVRDLASPRGVGSSRRARRRELLRDLDQGFQERARADALAATDAFYAQAYALIEDPKARAAFDLRKVDKKLRDRYGRSNIGQRLLMARRLVEAGVRYITVTDGGYDHHRDLARGLRARVRPLDQGFAALLQDLRASGLLDRTLVLLTTEFGRTPRYNADRGRDHWPRAFSIAMAGGGMRAGILHGSTVADGSEPDTDPVGPADMAATAFHLLGIDPDKRLLSSGGRPQALVKDGAVLEGLIRS